MKSPAPTRMDSLIGDSYVLARFADLPMHWQLSIVWRTVMDCESWADVVTPQWPSAEDAKAGLTQMLPQYVERYGDQLFGVATICTEAIKASVMQDEDIAGSYDSWEQYHAWYMRGGAVKHQESNRWPVTLSPDNYETLLDGWNRLHSYIRDGAAVIPAVFVPQEHHLNAA